VASRNRRNITGSGTPEKSHSAYPCEVAGGSSPAEPWDDSSPAEALGSRAAGTWRPGRTLCVAALVLAEVMYAVVAPRKPMGKRGPETERSPAGAAVVSPEGASRCEATRAACQRSVRTCRERCRSVGGAVAPKDPQRPCLRALSSRQRVRRRPGLTRLGVVHGVPHG
jgi:hypothetical protein